MKKLYWYLLVIGLLSIIISVNLYQKIFSSNIKIDSGEYEYIYIPTGAAFADVVDQLNNIVVLENLKSFEWVARKKKYDQSIKAGRFKIRNGMNNNELVNLLRAGKQDPIRLIFNNVRTLEALAGKISTQIEADSSALLNAFKDTLYYEQYGLNAETFISIFIPNTYHFFWNTSANQFVERMYEEYNKFWSDAKLKRLEEIGLTKLDVSTLASIIDEETTKNDEKARIAGVYINRLQRRIALQADPTVKFAVNDFTIKRVLTKHLQIDSPYNTYKYRGVPPGPIRIASISSINAVLNYEQHKYLYFCAKSDFSGYHDFAKTLAEHNKNAQSYRRALNKQRIWK